MNNQLYLNVRALHLKYPILAELNPRLDYAYAELLFSLMPRLDDFQVPLFPSDLLYWELAQTIARNATAYSFAGATALRTLLESLCALDRTRDLADVVIAQQIKDDFAVATKEPDEEPV